MRDYIHGLGNDKYIYEKTTINNSNGVYKSGSKPTLFSEILLSLLRTFIKDFLSRFLEVQ